MGKIKKNKNRFWSFVFTFSVVILLASILFISLNLYDKYFKSDDFTEFTNVSSQTQNNITEPTLPDNPIDFKGLKEINTDIYAWVRIPNTKVDYPVAQSYVENDSFYLNHNIYKKYDSLGTLFTEKHNSLDFNDPVTIIYGHNSYNGAMFRSLYNFKDKNFFDENRYLYIYTSGHILTYEVFAAYEYDNRHILNSYDFSNKQVFKEYLNHSKNPVSLVANVSDKVEVTENHRIITLSTCMAGKRNNRYLVQGVLIKDELTK